MSKGIKIINEVKLKGDNVEIDWADDVFKQFEKGDDDIIDAFNGVAMSIFNLVEVVIRSKK